MLKVTMILTNFCASSLSPTDFVKKHYLTDQAKQDMKLMDVEQDEWDIESEKKNLTNKKI